jgi:hypothetical protein
MARGELNPVDAARTSASHLSLYHIHCDRYIRTLLSAEERGKKRRREEKDGAFLIAFLSFLSFP